MEFSFEDFKLFRDLVKQKTGIYFRDEKSYFLKRRLEDRCKELNCDTFLDYYMTIKYSTTDAEFNNLIEALTTNETYFFRDIKQLESFYKEALLKVLKEKKKNNDKNLTVWSAGCSTGEEPYTLAMLLSEHAADMNIRILSTDINSKVINIAKKGVYYGRSLKDVPREYLNKYFNEKDGMYEVKECIKNKIDLRILNLIDKDNMRLIKNVDFIFCKNVLIYFDSMTAKQIINLFYDSLRKGGFIFLGLAESMHLLSGAFKLVKFKELFGYLKE